MTDADLFDSMAGEPQAGSEMQPAATDWEVDDMLEKNESANDGGKPNGLACPSQPGDWAGLEGSHATPAVAAGVIGMPPRRKGRGKNPLVMIGGIVVGGVLGLAIGYAILMWVFTKDPFSLAAKLPDFLVPAALKPAGNARVAQFAPANGGANDSGSNDNDSNNGTAREAGDGAKSGQPANNADQNTSGPFGNPFSTTETPTDLNTTGDNNVDPSKKPGTETLQPLPEPIINPFGTKTDEGAAGEKEKSAPAGKLPDATTSKDDQKQPLDPFAEGKASDTNAVPADAKEAAAKSTSLPDAKTAPTIQSSTPLAAAKRMPSRWSRSARRGRPHGESLVQYPGALGSGRGIARRRPRPRLR